MSENVEVTWTSLTSSATMLCYVLLLFWVLVEPRSLQLSMSQADAPDSPRLENGRIWGPMVKNLRLIWSIRSPFHDSIRQRNVGYPRQSLPNSARVCTGN